MAIYIAPQVRYQAPSAASAPKIIIIPDGNARSGYRGSAAKVVEVSEHCARRNDIAQLTIVILSGQNVLRRSKGALSQVAATVWQVRAMLQQSGALRRAGVRCALLGSLARLEQRGSAGAAIGAGVRSLIEATAAPDEGVTKLNLQLAVDCDDTLLEATGANAMIRSAAECSRVFRPSSLALNGGVMCVSDSAPWPELGVATIDAAVDALAMAPATWSPHGPDVIGELVELLDAPEAAPLQLIVPIAAAADALRTSLPLRRALRTRRAVLRLQDGTPIGDVKGEPRMTLSLTEADRPSIATAADMMVLPGQRGDALWVPPAVSPRRWSSLHACGPEVAAIARAVREAATFQEHHPPLHGADRFPARAYLGGGAS